MTRYVNLVILEENWEQKRDVEKYHIDTFVMEADGAGKFDFLSDLFDVFYLPRTPKISITQIKRAFEKKDK